MMDNVELTRWKTLANDAVIATFGQNSREAQLATALEQAVEVMEYYGSDYKQRTAEPEPAIVDLDTVQAIHKQLIERIAEIEKVVTLADEMVDDLRETLKDLKHDIKELGDEL